MVSRTCTKCGIEKPLEDFTTRKGGKFGRKSVCKLCCNESLRANYALHAEKMRERGRRNHAANRDRNNARSAAYKIANAAAIRRQRKQYVTENRDKRIEQSRAWYDKNRERSISKALAWMLANPERTRVTVRKNNAVRKSRKRANGGKMTRKEWDALLDYYNHSCAYCLRHESEVGTLEIDHMLPVCRGGDASVDNSAPACRSCNASKLHRTPMEYLARQCGFLAF